MAAAGNASALLATTSSFSLGDTTRRRSPPPLPAAPPPPFLAAAANCLASRPCAWCLATSVLWPHRTNAASSYRSFGTSAMQTQTMGEAGSGADLGASTRSYVSLQGTAKASAISRWED